MHQAYLGCDPGAKGAICILYPESKMTLFYPTPGGKTPLGDIHYQLLMNSPATLVVASGIEEVHSLYGMSAKSNFNFGANFGAAKMLLEALASHRLDLEIQQIQPKVWQKGVGITAKGKEIKAAVAELARKLYPDCDIYGPKGGLLDGRADALMIAHYLYLQEQGD